MFLAVTRPSINSISVFSADQDDSQELISSAMNSVILILHFPFLQRAAMLALQAL